jgi:hypothetical protein
VPIPAGPRGAVRGRGIGKGRHNYGNDRGREGGIIIPDTAKEKPQEGEVVAVGNGAKSKMAR